MSFLFDIASELFFVWKNKIFLTGESFSSILTISKRSIYFLKEGERMIEQYLLENYEKGEPIFLSDLCMEGMTEENLRYHLKRMTDDGKISRFAPGIYYCPKTNLLGEKQILSPETVRKGISGIKANPFSFSSDIFMQRHCLRREDLLFS